VDGHVPVSSYASRLPRPTGKVLVDLRWWMVAFGLDIGVAFPFVVVLLGVPRTSPCAWCSSPPPWPRVSSWPPSTTAQSVIGVCLRVLAAGTQRVETSLIDASYSGYWSACDPQSCQVPVDSADDLGTFAESFNHVVDALAASHRVSDPVGALSQALTAHLALAADLVVHGAVVGFTPPMPAAA
jgi:hypothetical protein